MEMGITFKRDRNGNMTAYKNGKKVGTVGGMGDSKPQRNRSTKRTTTKKK